MEGSRIDLLLTIATSFEVKIHNPKDPLESAALIKGHFN